MEPPGRDGAADQHAGAHQRRDAFRRVHHGVASHLRQSQVDHLRPPGDRGLEAEGAAHPQARHHQHQLVPVLHDRTHFYKIYHEACLCNLLQIILFSRTAIDSADDCILELTDYCYRKLLALLTGEKKKAAAPSAKELMDLSPLQDLNRQINDTEFNIQMMSLSILRFITDHIKVTFWP